MKTLNTYWIDFYKTDDLSPDEMNCVRGNAQGLWLLSGHVTAESRRHAIAVARREIAEGVMRGEGCKLRTRL